MNQQRHIIKKQIIELNLSSQQGTFELQNEVGRIYRRKVIPLLDDFLSQFSDLDIIHRINTLEINLGNIDINNLEQELIEKIIEQIQQQLAEQISLSSSRSSAQPQSNTKLRESSPLPRKTEVLSNEIEGETGKNTKENQVTSANTTRDEIPFIYPSKFRLELWRGIFFSLLFGRSTQSKNIQFTSNHLLHLAASFRLNYLLLLDKMLEEVENLKKQEGETFKSQLPEILAQINPTVSRENSSIASESEQSINQQEARAQTEDRLTNTVAPFSDSDEIYIYNSGLVLLWPFLPRFFESLKLIQQGHFVNSESAERAVLILQYLVDAATEIPEHLLPLNKILCGIDLLEPVAANLEIAEQERDESEHLLSAVISNWSILKNTSSDGFRRAFLQREGILKVRDRSWLLQVEQETYDVLLDRLPWSISVVKLPWMNELLYVEW